MAVVAACGDPYDGTPISQRVVEETGATLDPGSGNNLMHLDVQQQAVNGIMDTVTVTVSYSATTMLLGPVTNLVSRLWGGSVFQGNQVPMRVVAAMPVMASAQPTPTSTGSHHYLVDAFSIAKHTNSLQTGSAMDCGAGVIASDSSFQWHAPQGSGTTLYFLFATPAPAGPAGTSVSGNGGPVSLSQNIGAGVYYLYVWNTGSEDATVDQFHVTCP